MKVTKVSIKKIQWLIRNPVFRQKPLTTLLKIIQWEVVRLFGKPIHYLYDNTLSVLLYPNDGVARLVYYFDYHESVEFCFLKHLLSQDMICLDIGANIGMYSLFMSKRSKFVYAFEPQAQSVNRLNKSIADNHIYNIKVIQKAVGDKSGTLSFHFVKEDSAKSYITSAADVYSCLVDVVSLDDYFNENLIEKLDYLKIDAEGAESAILQGAIRTIKKYRPIIQVEFVAEFQTRNSNNAFRPSDFFRDMGYEVFHIDEATCKLIPGMSWNSIVVPAEKMIDLRSKNLVA